MDNFSTVASRPPSFERSEMFCGKAAASSAAASSAFVWAVSSSIPIGALGLAGGDPVSLVDMISVIGLGVGQLYSFSLIAIAVSVLQ